MQRIRSRFGRQIIAVTAAACLLARSAVAAHGAAAEEPACLRGSEPAALTRATANWPFRVGAEGAFLETTEGAGVTAYLDDERVAHLMTFEYMGEGGRTFVVLHFESATSYTIGTDAYRYSHPIHRDPTSIEVTLVESECFRVHGGKVVGAPPGADTESAESIIANLGLVLASYMPYELTFPSAPPVPTTP